MIYIRRYLNLYILFTSKKHEVLVWPCLCLQALKKPGGICYLAAKSFYFGVGGGIAAFNKLVEQDGELECLQVAVLDDGKSNKREILKLEYK